MSGRRSSARRPPSKRPPRRRSHNRPPTRRRRSRGRGGGIQRFGRRSAIIAAVLVALGVFGLSRIDFDETLQELTLPLRHDDIIRQQADEKEVPADLIAAVIYAESRFRDQTSSAGARGLMQITPDTADVIENLSGGETFVHSDLADPELNIRYGTFFLRHLIDRYDGNLVAVLAAYNAGMTNADNWGGADLEVEDIEFPETRQYVEDVLDKRRDYRDAYEDELGL